ncbi:bifunctional glycosyltransferase family 2/GtrA family protein [Robertmurraya korlensis]|uniref:bifunctional glycosyltransferase family 2/GtrA family protein n=1 Tax=Robertmurraya korlensis TaxID=519977 RepID=UPI00203B3552|nr:bifunctional glycosyltransferase family 2/GtrA family protein [Robertmurraya korlensis]MCM3601860.1 bifunctional glycosyltransferase family 2/GtrA family protein [Robertmurraya korlensis]
MIIVIPAYEPSEKMLQLIKEVQQNSSYRVLIVNDGSSVECEGLFEQVAQRGGIVLTHETNQGKGAALKTAFTHIRTHFPKEEGIVCADCDGQHRWEDIQRVALELADHPQTIVLGARKFVGKVPLKSLIGNKVTRTIFSLVAGYKINDTQTGLRGFSVDMLKWLIDIKGKRYEYEMNQLLEAKSAGYQIHSMPIQTVYENNNKGSHFRPIHDSIRIYLPILKFSLSSVSCGLIDFICFFLLHGLTNNLLFSVIGARVISSFINYLINKNIVFNRKKQSHIKPILKYYSLAGFILISNYLMISLFNDTGNLSLFTSKSFTEGILFIVSYYVQKKFIF